MRANPHPTCPCAAGQAWYWPSTGSTLALFPANQVLALFDAIAYTDGFTQAQQAYKLPAAAPGPLYKYNLDAAGDALAKHFTTGPALPAADVPIGGQPDGASAA